MFDHETLGEIGRVVFAESLTPTVKHGSGAVLVWARFTATGPDLIDRSTT